MKTFKEYLEEMRKLFQPHTAMENETLYHGTSPSNVSSILRDGIKSDNSKYNNQTFLTKSYSEAQKYAKIANNGKPGVVLQLHKHTLDPDHLKPSPHDPSVYTYTKHIPPTHVRKFL